MYRLHIYNIKEIMSSYRQIFYNWKGMKKYLFLKQFFQ
jgi:hypothetical protein